MPEQWTDEVLEAALADLATRFELPARERLVTSVLAGLPVVAPRRPRRPSLRLVLAIVIAVAVATLGLSPAARAKVRDWIGVDGIRVEQVASTTTGSGPSPSFSSTVPLPYGSPVTLSDAAARLGRPVRLPHSGVLGEPNEVLFGRPPPDGQVTLLWRPSATVPPSAANPELGVALTQFAGRADSRFFTKVVQPGTRVEFLRVQDVDAWWIEGPLHTLIYVRPDGSTDEVPSRLAGNTLIWSKDGTTFRLESSLSREVAVAIAETVS
jgi:hypothetical protein